MTLVDTSAWVEFLRATGSATHQAVRQLLADDEPTHTTDVVVMEVLAAPGTANTATDCVASWRAVSTFRYEGLTISRLPPTSTASAGRGASRCGGSPTV